MQLDPNSTPLITVEQAATFLGIGRAQAYAAVHRGELPVIKIGRSLRVPTALLLAMLGLPTLPDAEVTP